MINKNPDPDFYFHIEDDLLIKLDQLCKATDRDRAYHIDKALRAFLDQSMQIGSETAIGIEAADAGCVTPLDQVKKTWSEKT